MTEQEKLTYLSRCRCVSCAERDNKKEKSLEQLHLDSVFARTAEQLADYVLEKIKTHKEVSAKFVNAVNQETRHLLHEAFDASCEYGFRISKDRTS